MERDQEFVLTVVKYLVENPDKVQVDRTVDEMGVLLTLSVDPADMGKIIGKEGRTAKSIRTLLRVLGARENARVNLKIAEPEGSTFVRPSAVDDSASDDSASNDSGATAVVSNSDDTAAAAPLASDDQPMDDALTNDQVADRPSDDMNQINDVTEQQDENPTSIL